MKYLFVCVLVIGCTSINTPHTPQQKSLTPANLKTITDPIYDVNFEPDEDIVAVDENEEPIDQKFYRKISISVSESMKLRDIFVQLARKAGVNIFIAQDIAGSVAFEAKSRPFLDIIRDICSSCYLKYSIRGDCLKIENDAPFTKVYDLQFLNIQRKTQSSVSISTDMFNNSSVIGNGTQKSTNTTKDNGSTSVVSGLITSDFWSELEQNIKHIVGDEGSVSVHRQGGLISVYAPQFKQEKIQKYIDLLRATTESQVLIEAKILEVDLNDEFKNGINWDIFRGAGVNFSRDYSDRAGLISFGFNRKDLNVVYSIIERFGAVKTLSSPRITVLNNQSAVLKVARNEVIYVPEIQRQYTFMSSGQNTDFVTTTLHTIPIGLIISVQPSIDTKHNTVLLNLRPTISRICGFKSVPYFYSMSNGSNSSTSSNTQKIPIIDVKEMDSVLKLKSGQVVVMGGLMKEKSANLRSGLPYAEPLDPIFGEREKTTDVTELVIFLKATILKNRNKYHAADKKLYDTYANDPRPLNFSEKTDAKK